VSIPQNPPAAEDEFQVKYIHKEAGIPQKTPGKRSKSVLYSI